MDFTKQETEIKERDYAKDVELTVLAVEVVTSLKDSEKIEKIIFKTNKGNITHKPKVDTSEFREGIKVLKKTSPYFAEMPEIVKELGRQLQINPSVKVKGSYAIWNTEADGEKVTYRYVQYATELNSWVIIKNEEVIN